MGFTQKLRSILQVAWIDFHGTAGGNPFYLFTPFIYPLSVLLIMFLYTNWQYIGVLLAGAVLYAAINAGIAVFSEVAASKLYFKIQDLYVASPTSPFVYCLGIGLSWFLINFLAFIFYLALAIFVNHSSLLAIPVVLLMALVLVFVLSCLSFFAGTHMSSDKDVFTLGSIFTFAIFLLSPVYYPITTLPGPLQYAAFIFPSTGPAVITHAALGIVQLPQEFLLLALANIVAYVLIALFAVKHAKWRET